MTVNKENLERRVDGLNEWLMENPDHPQRKIKEQKRNYYVRKLGEMDDYELKTIEIH